MQCRELMKTHVECLSSQDTVQNASRKMRDANIGFLPICDVSKRVLGTVTDRDIALRVVAEGRQASTPVSEVMSREVVACRPEDDLKRAQDLMTRHHKSRIMITDPHGKLMGIISLSDLAQRDGAEAISVLRGVSARESRTTM